MFEPGASELILNQNQRLYHLDVVGEDIADKVILVGDPSRVEKISRRFSKIECTRSHREFITHTGTFQSERFTVMSTGIGTDNIDIVLNELDAAVNMDLQKRCEKATRRKLTLLRLGTSGALHPEIQVNSLLCSAFGLGFDALLPFYREAARVVDPELSAAFKRFTNWPWQLPNPYAVPASLDMLTHFRALIPLCGITATAPGFYGPQGRTLRLPAFPERFQESLAEFEYTGYKITNFEMETSALYGLAALLGHQSLTVCVIIANRARQEFSTDLKTCEEHLIDTCLERFTTFI